MKFHSSLKVNSIEGKTVFIDLTESWQSLNRRPRRQDDLPIDFSYWYLLISNCFCIRVSWLIGLYFSKFR